MILAAAAWINAHAHKVEAEAERAERYELADGYQAFIESQMKREGCEP